MKLELGLRLLTMALACSVLTSCVSEEEQEQIGDVFNPDLSDPGTLPPPQVQTGCFYDRFTQPEAEISKKLDILFVTDTSGSFNQERGAVADAIDSFVQALPLDVDYRIAVMLAHGSLSSKHGKLFRSTIAHTTGEPLVLDSQVLTLNEIRTHLRNKLTRVVEDGGSDGGEEGLFSLYKALEPAQFAQHQLDGFFRADAALATIFVADENDICAIYPQGVTPVFDPNWIEPQAFARDCSGITPQAVLERLQASKEGLPLFVGGVIYNNLATVPSGGENEYGYGYAETVQMANGLTIDLADGQYQVGMTSMGQLVTVTLNLQTQFSLTRTDVDPASVQAFVDAAAVPFYYAAETNTVNLTSVLGGPLSTVDLVYCPNVLPNNKVADICEMGSFVAKPNPKLGLSIDPAEGSQTTIVNGLIGLGFPPTVYTDAEVAAGDPISEGVDVLIIARKVVLSAVNQAYIDGVLDYISSGGSLITEYDGTALLFTDYNGTNPILNNVGFNLELFSGLVQGGGAVLPTNASTTHVVDPTHPIVQGLPSSFNNGLRSAFAITEFDGTWLDTPAEFVSQGSLGLVPKGTFPAVLAGRCGQGRVAGFTMTHLTVINQQPVSTMIGNAINWVSGN